VEPKSATRVLYDYLIDVALVLNLLNLLPVFPLDGGQLLMEGMTWKKPPARG